MMWLNNLFPLFLYNNGYYKCCGAPKELGHMYGCPNSPENKK